MEFVKVGQAFGIEWDRNMFILAQNGDIRRAVVKSSNINDELGQIEYLFTDKTGTLTRNKMELSRIFVDGIFIRNVALQSSSPDVDEIACVGSLSQLVNSAFFPLSTHSEKQKLESHLHSGSWLRSRVLMLNLLVCNTITMSGGEDNSSSEESEDSAADPVVGLYASSSPDEIAFVAALHLNNASLIECSTEHRTILIPESEELNLPALRIKYEILGVLQFSADRSRMSVVVKDSESGEVWIHTKGADSVVLKLVRRDTEQEQK